MDHQPGSGTNSAGFVKTAAHPAAPSPEAEIFYAEALRVLNAQDIPFLVGGTYAVSAYTGISRPTKDLDIICKPGDLPRILNLFREYGDEIEIEDERWIGKVRRGPLFFDVIFACANGTSPVTDPWFEAAPEAEVLGTIVHLIAPTELIWSKAFIQLRHRHDGSDIAHMILKQHQAVDWRRLLFHMEAHWEILLTLLLNFRWIYPSERDLIPRRLMDELLERLRLQLDLPPPQLRICRGRMLSHIDYDIDIRDWGFADRG